MKSWLVLVVNEDAARASIMRGFGDRFPIACRLSVSRPITVRIAKPLALHVSVGGDIFGTVLKGQACCFPASRTKPPCGSDTICAQFAPNSEALSLQKPKYWDFP
jgi:hypothetical protein